jgi:hypothetical protein
LAATSSITVGEAGKGRVTVSNGTVQARTMILGNQAGAAGTLTAAGGVSSVFSNVLLGNFACTATGIVNIVGGELDVTNAAGNAVIEVRSGSVILNSGTLMVDKFVMTNSCASFVHTGGTLIYSNAVLISSRDDDGDGIPNALDPFPLEASNAGADSDGDGLTDLQEYLAGTNPTNSASFFGITAITKESNDIRVTWMTGPGKTNALESTAGVAGSFTNNYSVLTNIVTTGSVTNYLDLGAATNVPSFYYRVRLVP